MRQEQVKQPLVIALRGSDNISQTLTVVKDDNKLFILKSLFYSKPSSGKLY